MRVDQALHNAARELGDKAGLDLRPWYQRVEVRALLRECVECPPPLAYHKRQYARSRDEWSAFDREDGRVATLDEIRDAHLTPILNHPTLWSEATAAGAKVTADMAIDAVLPAPLAGSAGNPDYWEALPVINLEMGRAV